MQIKNIKLAMLIGCLSASPLVFATGDGFYMGGQIGYANLNNVAENIRALTFDPPLPDPQPSYPNCNYTDNPASELICNDITPTNTGIAARIFLGANVKTYFGFESGISYYTPSEYEPDNVPNTNQPHIWEYSWDVLGKIMYPIGPVTIFAKGGIAIVSKSMSGAIDPTFDIDDESSNGNDIFVTPAYGFGVSYDMTQNWVLDFSFMKIQGTDELENIDFAAIGISYHFVDEYCGQFLC